ncbi:peptide chain release factor N(5)-glutamine methyltransferase [Hyphomicrobium sp.]|uniref:peptide chain release factor N(5)-glutamine methyltransferase n=1 Tax=Hyphomicrobium sp. TaxID=82 RepID=UPI002D77CEFB|nr:peptide chain release factor N(5)-glutamine methyltransferase [Hyphomicrobium sp.]HET6387725.1 peptide chain release factor N(5)-glutamine methyltransferase [Hyphomicrobium sp.]
MPLRLAPEQSIADASAAMARAFAEAGLDSPQRDARFLLQGLLGLDGAQLFSASSRPLGEAAEIVSAAATRRLAHEPVSRILGKREFYGREFIVTPDVLDPRPDTEAIVDLALEVVKSSGLAGRPIRIADIGTGSGILIATLLAELPEATGVATDVSLAALDVARQNARKLGVADRIEFVATSGLSGCEGPFDLVVSNPPYIPAEDIAGLEREVKDFDPRLALDGGPDGLDVYREIARQTLNLPRPLRVVVEVGSTQADAVEGVFSDAGAQPLARRRDLGGHVRAVAMEIHL